MPWPEGFRYVPECISPDEERALLDAITPLAFNEIRMHGVVAKRRTLHYGWLYGYEAWSVRPGPPIPGFLLPIRERLAAIVATAPETLEEALITEYTAGAVIGWHRDAPMFGAIVVGLSLASSCRMRFRRAVPGGGFERAVCDLAPRSAYVLSGPARSEWQHSIPAVASLRYSITFRQLRPRRSGTTRKRHTGSRVES